MAKSEIISFPQGIPNSDLDIIGFVFQHKFSEQWDEAFDILELYIEDFYGHSEDSPEIQSFLS